MENPKKNNMTQNFVFIALILFSIFLLLGDRCGLVPAVSDFGIMMIQFTMLFIILGRILDFFHLEKIYIPIGYGYFFIMSILLYYSETIHDIIFYIIDIIIFLNIFVQYKKEKIK